MEYIHVHCTHVQSVALVPGLLFCLTVSAKCLENQMSWITPDYLMHLALPHCIRILVTVCVHIHVRTLCTLRKQNILNMHSGDRGYTIRMLMLPNSTSVANTSCIHVYTHPLNKQQCLCTMGKTHTRNTLSGHVHNDTGH